MGDVVNLNRYRKARDRRERAENAEANRAKFGRTKHERTRLQIESRRENAELEGKLLEDKSDRTDEPETP